MNAEALFQIGYYGCLGSILLGVLIGLAAVWLEGTLPPDIIRKLSWTDGILFGGSVLVTIVSWIWLSAMP